MKLQWLLVAVLPAMMIGCSGGGGGTTPPEYKMADLVAPINTGTEGGFNYDATNRQTVAVDIILPYQNGAVSIYDNRPLTSLTDSSGNPLAVPVVSQSVLLDQGQAATNLSGVFHYQDTISISADITSLYIVPMMGVYPSNITIPITHGTATFTFAIGSAP